jgi:hypothetical protein
MADTFPPPRAHGPITPVTEGVYCVRGTFKLGPGLVISRTMTIVKVPEGLVIVTPVRLDAAGEAELLRLGKVLHVVTLSDAHGVDAPYYVKTFGAPFWTVPGARQKRLPVDRVLGPESPIPGAEVLALPPSPPESVLWLPHGGGTLITCDVIQHHVDTEGASFLARLMTPIMGFKGGVIVPKMWRKIHRVAPADVATVLAEVGKRSFSNLVTGHGPPVVGGADQRVRAAIAAFGR